MNCVTPREVAVVVYTKSLQTNQNGIFFLSSSNPQERQRIEKWRKQKEKKEKKWQTQTPIYDQLQ